MLAPRKGVRLGAAIDRGYLLARDALGVVVINVAVGRVDRVVRRGLHANHDAPRPPQPARW